MADNNNKSSSSTASLTSYSENIEILANSWNVGQLTAEVFGDTLNKTILMLYDANKATTIRQALQIIAADLFGTAKTAHHIQIISLCK